MDFRDAVVSGDGVDDVINSDEDIGNIFAIVEFLPVFTTFVSTVFFCVPV